MTDTPSSPSPSPAADSLGASRTIPLLRELAEQGDLVAQLALGHLYDEGIAIGKDEAEALRCYRMAAEQGDAQGQYLLGASLSASDDADEVEEAAADAEAFGWMLKSARQGYAEAMHEVAHHYEWGDGVQEDKAEAVAWLRKAAEAGHADSMFELGKRYAEGDGVAKDKAEARRWQAMAVEHGSIKARFEQLYKGNKWKMFSYVGKIVLLILLLIAFKVVMRLL